MANILRHRPNFNFSKRPNFGEVICSSIWSHCLSLLLQHKICPLTHFNLETELGWKDTNTTLLKELIILTYWNGWQNANSKLFATFSFVEQIDDKVIIFASNKNMFFTIDSKSVTFSPREKSIKFIRIKIHCFYFLKIKTNFFKCP